MTQQVLGEGGLEATLEGPALYTALDVLAVRAKAWTTRNASKKSHQTLIDPDIAGECAEKTVREVGLTNFNLKFGIIWT